LAFDRMLAQAAVEAGAELRCGAALVHCESTNDGGWLLRLNENGTGDPILRGARVLIDATGRAAHLARWVGAQRAVLDRLVGLATLFADVDTSREGFVLVETSHEGWWYSAPIPPERMMVMLMTDSDVCGRAKLATRPRWHQLLANAQQTVGRVGGVALWGPRVFSAVSQRLRRSELRAPWLAAGDAALAVDPVSGSGVIRALRSARASARTALAVLEGHADGAIKAYEDDVDLDCTKYLRERALYYGVEQRWRAFPFWQRRGAFFTGVAAA
jgi:flavin-dependent dehydrogenase